MKRKFKISLYILSILLLFSCDYKDTHVINTVHKDGSITRKVTVKTNTSKFVDFKDMDVPIDSTWQIETKMVIGEVERNGEKYDTTYYLTAEKHFKSVNQINNDYINDIGSGRGLKRKANFSKSFRWFTTVFRYSESIEKFLEIECLLSDFLSEEELNFVNLPDKVQNSLLNGSDSLKYIKISDAVDTNLETWYWTSEIRQWIEVFYNLFGENPNLNISKGEMLSKESQFAEFLMNTGPGSNAPEMGEDSMFNLVLGKEFYLQFKNEIDSTSSTVQDIELQFSSDEYDMEIRMPGKIIATNGYAETNTENEGKEGILWTVNFWNSYTQNYEMWVESRVNNYFMWIVAAVFIFFVIVGFVRFQKKKNS